jgi:type IV pilus assembly protein PilQ
MTHSSHDEIGLPLDMRVAWKQVFCTLAVLWLIAFVSRPAIGQDTPTSSEDPDITLQSDQVPQPGGNEREIPSESVSKDRTTSRQVNRQESSRTDSLSIIQPLGLPESVQSTIASLNIQNGNLRDVFRGIASEYGISLIVDPKIDQSITLRLTNVTVLDAIRYLCREHGLDIQQTGSILRIYKPAPPPPAPLDIQLESGRLSFDLSDAPIQRVARRLSEVSPYNVMTARGVQGKVNGYLDAAPFEKGLTAFLNTQGYELQKEGDIYTIVNGTASNTQSAGSRGSNARRSRGRSSSPRSSGGYRLDVVVENDSVSLQVQNAEIYRIVNSIVQQTDIELITYQRPEGTITATATGLSINEAFGYLLRGTGIIYRRDDNRYVLAEASQEGMSSSRLIELEHLKAEHLSDMLPDVLKQNVATRVVKEQNAVIATGSGGALDEIEAFARQVDNPTPQIMVEALVVDFENTNLFELGVEVERPAEDIEGERYSFDDGGYRLEADGDAVNGYVDSISDWLGWDGVRNIGRLPSNFGLKIRALAREGKAEVRSRPQISTLNGHQASISIGTTQFFILRGSSNVGRPQPQGNYIPVETERFEKIEANVTLDITPRVTASGEVTVDIRPEFSTPVGQFDSSVPPTINTRVVESTVRLRDGETIILGGLIQETKRVQLNKVPILGQIPLLGRLFQNRSHDTRKSELVIFITPHVFYGGNQEKEKWMELQKDYDATYDD